MAMARPMPRLAPVTSATGRSLIGDESTLILDESSMASCELP
jgi:hypothetical protein